ncbi:RNA-binding protein 5-A-like [Coregonus clupeaformis]|uniref:RNA-binding protein 5-A-like n=1 Tax=Coregonus clupeaformis TaxID=59861 RepID=UPI001E1C7AE3|nr:RNA-binding protein 5-A-like [Coregonus clupeaformis]
MCRSPSGTTTWADDMRPKSDMTDSAVTGAARSTSCPPPSPAESSKMRYEGGLAAVSLVGGMSQTSGEMTQSGMKDWTETQSGIMTIAGVTRDTLTDMMSAEIETALSFACPLQLTTVFLQRGRKSDRSEDGYLSDGDYQEQDYKMELGEEESKAIMLRGLSLQVTEEDIWAALEQLQGPQLVDIRLMKKRTSAPGVKALIATAAGVVMSQTAQVYQHHLLSQPAIQYYYNSQTQQYLYWNSETQTYIAAAAETTQQLQTPAENRPLQQPHQHGGGFETQLVKNELVKKGEPETPAKSSLVAVYSGGSDPEEAADPDQGIGGDERSDKLTDWRKMTCLLCLRQFPSEDALLLVHQQLQTCRMQNVEIHRRSKLLDAELEELERKDVQLKYRDRAAERRDNYGVPEPPAPKKKKFYQT